MVVVIPDVIRDEDCRVSRAETGIRAIRIRSFALKRYRVPQRFAN